ncbi:MAG: chorismate--pyruvate lyase [Gammaproteobacteria bacterium]|jgi:chorismate--pyruvate lyase|nr:chorismate--pyruvate lyase [Gammaproteobacteria bacterium]
MYKQEIKIPDFNWQSYKSISMASMPEAVRERLLDSGSLTCYLEQHAQKSFNVEVVNTGWLYAKPSEVQYLGIHPREKIWVREVFLRCDRNIKVYAWSVFPESTITGKYKGLQRLGSKPLGKILFNQSNVIRSEFEIAQIANDHPLYQKITRELHNKPEFLWARRSVFKLDDKPLLVNEVFMPSFFSGF